MHATQTLPAVRRRAAFARTAGGYWVLLAVLALYLAYAGVDGLSGSEVVRAVLGVAVTQLLPGVLLWRCVRPRDGWLLEDLAMGFAMGIAIVVPTQTIAGYSHQRWIALVLPLLVAALLLAVPVTRRRIMSARWSPLPWWLGGGIAALSASTFPMLVAYFRVNQPRWATGVGQPHVDTYLHLALSSELLERGPAAWPTVIGEALGYQWFAHAWIAQVTASTGVPLDEVLMRFLPAIMPIVSVTCVAALCLRLTRSAGIALGAVALASLAGVTAPVRTLAINPMITPQSPTLGLGIPTLMALIAILAMRWRGEALRGAIVMVPILTVIATGTKGSTAPVVIAGLGLALLAALIWRRRLVPHLVVDLLMMGVALVATLAIVFHGSASGLMLGVTESAKQTRLAGELGGAPTYFQQRALSAITILIGLGPALLGFAALWRREDRRDPVIWVLLGASIAGAAATGLFSHPGKSQGYFLLTALPLAAIATAIGADRVLRTLSVRGRALLLGFAGLGAVAFVLLPTLVLGPLRTHTFRRLEESVLIGLVILVAAGVIAVIATRDTDRRYGARIGLSAAAGAVVLSGPVVYGQYLSNVKEPSAHQHIKLSEAGASSNAQIAAAVYIRDHSGVEDLVMTNRHCTRQSAPYHCDTRRWLVTAFSQRQALIEGWTATNTATRLAPHGRDSVTIDYWHPQLLQLNDGFYTHPTAAAARQLWDKGVRWVYEENTMKHAKTLAPYATLRFRDSGASAWQLNRPS
ncbi:hypothetical protein [Allobranchiibius huperziae]|uniref:Uncharacterized protein n=1 Tax=Allobranchiibius huperziae TaxID=1874116 RepID=A0A853DIE0_9MICO|nr:hypothetical protein [Allobranchiibius huperziae]NYJ75739.1 hypothetical protein [Allobranchiibius huperziae]